MRMLKTIALLATAVGALGATAHANTLLSQKLTLNVNSYTSNPGGEFTANNLVGFGNTLALEATNLGAGSFETFCVEKNTYFSPGTSYWVQLNNVSLSTNQPLSTDTAYLFTHFWNGDLQSFDFSSAGRRASDFSLQNAIWYFQNQFTLNNISGDTLAQTFIAEAQNAVSTGQWSGTGNVSILNLWATQDGTGDAQDQLCLTAPAVPLPKAGLGGAAVFAALGAKRARRQLFA